MLFLILILKSGYALPKDRFSQFYGKISLFWGEEEGSFQKY